MRAANIKRSATVRTYPLPFLNLLAAAGAMIAKGVHALARRAKMYITVDQCAALQTRLFIACHSYTSCRAPHSPQKRILADSSAPQEVQYLFGGTPSFVPHS